MTLEYITQRRDEAAAAAKQHEANANAALGAVQAFNSLIAEMEREDGLITSSPTDTGATEAAKQPENPELL